MTVRVLLVGHGKMGQMIEQIISDTDGIDVTKIIDAPNLDELKTLNKVADVIIDFSSPTVFPLLSDYVKRTGTALVSGTTGYTDEGAQVKGLGEYAPVIYAENYSRGVNALAAVVEQAARLLGEGFDIELVEAHHRYKKDSPSGTAQLLLRAADPDGKKSLAYGREGVGEGRPHDQIGVHSLRGGTVPGEHMVGFYGNDEIIEISHRAFSRRIFAQGAVDAACLLVTKPVGTYTYQQLLAV